MRRMALSRGVGWARLPSDRHVADDSHGSRLQRDATLGTAVLFARKVRHCDEKPRGIGPNFLRTSREAE